MQTHREFVLLTLCARACRRLQSRLRCSQPSTRFATPLLQSHLHAVANHAALSIYNRGVFFGGAIPRLSLRLGGRG